MGWTLLQHPNRHLSIFQTDVRRDNPFRTEANLDGVQASTCLFILLDQGKGDKKYFRALKAVTSLSGEIIIGEVEF